MIYFVYKEFARESFGYPEVICTNRDIDYISMKTRYRATSIFEFKEGEVHYLKVRDGNEYTSEELVILKLKAVPF